MLVQYCRELAPAMHAVTDTEMTCVFGWLSKNCHGQLIACGLQCRRIHMLQMSIIMIHWLADNRWAGFACHIRAWSV